MKQEKNGFTLVELLAVIVLLSIILTIAVVSISSIKGRVNARQYSQLASTIELAAEKYAAETGVKTIFVQTLINEGLVETDSESNDLYDPRDHSSSLNCQKIVITDGKATLFDEENAECNMDLIKDSAIAIKYRYADDEKDVVRLFTDDELQKNGGWLNRKIILFAESTGIFDLGDIRNNPNLDYTWISPLAPDEVYKSPEITINEVDVADTYRVTVTIEGRDYVSEQLVRIDKVAPLLSDFIIKNPDSWSTTKTLQFKLTDKGSGIAGYYISGDCETIPKDEDWDTSVAGNTADVEIELDLLSDVPSFEETKKICVWTKDNAGNIGNNENVNNGNGGGLSIDKIDTEAADDISLEKDNDEYTTSLKLIGKAIDKKSGLVAYAFNKCDKPPINDDDWKTITRTNIEITYEDNLPYTEDLNSKNDDTKDYCFWVKDYVGNESEPAKVKVDNLDLKINSVSVRQKSNADIIATSAVLELVATDEKSMINKYCVSTDANTCNSDWKQLLTSTKNFTLDYTVESNGKYYLCVMDSVGNEACSSTFANVQNVDREGPKFTSGGYVTCGSLGRTYWDDASDVASLYYYVSSSYSQPSDYYFTNEVSVTGTTSIPCYSDPCGTTYYVWIKATDNLGNISYTRIGSYSTKACCDPGTWTYSYCTSNGYAVYKRYNGCLNKNETETRDYEGCYTSTSCYNVGSCNYSGYQSRSCSYYFAGYRYTYDDTASCQGPVECENYWSICSGGRQTRWCHYYMGGSFYEYQQSQSCSVAPSPSTSGGGVGQYGTFCNAGGIPFSGAKLHTMGMLTHIESWNDYITGGSCSYNPSGPCHQNGMNWNYTCTGFIPAEGNRCALGF